MSNEEKKTWLNRYRLAGLAVQRLTEEIARWEAQAVALTARYGEASGSSGEDSLQRAVEKMLELRDELAEELLRLRYLEGLTWERVAERMECSQQWIHKLHYDAIAQVDGEKIGFKT